MHTRAQSSTIHNHQNVEATEMPVHGWVGTQNAVYAYSGVLLSRHEVLAHAARMNLENMLREVVQT